MRLQGINYELPTIRVDQLKVGDIRVYNFGYKGKVLDIEECKSGKSLKIRILSLDSNKEFVRTLRKETQVVIA